MRNSSWQAQAVCARPGIHPAVISTLTSDQATPKALLLCATCPVAIQCARWALGERHFEGVAAGAIWHERGTPQVTDFTPEGARRVIGHSIAKRANQAA